MCPSLRKRQAALLSAAASEQTLSTLRTSSQPVRFLSAHWRRASRLPMADHSADPSAALSRLRISTRVPPGPAASINVPCRFFQAGYCANGDSCRFLHQPRASPDASQSQSRTTPPPSAPLPTVSTAPPTRFSRPSSTDYVVRPGVVNVPTTAASQYVDFSAAYAAVFDEHDKEDDEQLLRAASSPQHAASFITSVREVRATSYAAAARPDNDLIDSLAETYSERRLQQYAEPWAASSPNVSMPNSMKSIVCKYHAEGDCRYGEHCRYSHGLRCSTCGKNALHPTDRDEAQRHEEACKKEQERKNRIERCATVECGICYESTIANGRKFGLLENCDHAFCLQCIREWRGAESVGTFGREAVRVCPVCRTESFVVIPSDTYEKDKGAKQALLDAYKAKLSSIPCRHFNFGQNECPFAGSCFYAHVDAEGKPVAPPERPALLVSDSGVRVKTAPRLADYLPG